jgi:hypothetical protein
VTVRIPGDVRWELRRKLWAEAERLNWQNLMWHEKSPMYEQWTRDPAVGGRLSHYMDQRQIRVYIKDTIMKGYIRNRQSSASIPFDLLGISHGEPVSESWERPHGKRLADGRVIVWGNAEDWKLVVTAVHERAYGIAGATLFAAVLLSALGKFHQQSVRQMVEDAAIKLGVERVVWSPA